MQNAGLGGKYNNFFDFTLDELAKHIGLYLLQGLSPYPQVEMKFYLQKEDPVNGSDLINCAFRGRSATRIRRHRNFKCFFDSVNTTIHPPSRYTYPNWKVHPLLKHMLKVSHESIFLGC